MVVFISAVLCVCKVTYGHDRATRQTDANNQGDKTLCKDQLEVWLPCSFDRIKHTSNTGRELCTRTYCPSPWTAAVIRSWPSWMQDCRAIALMGISFTMLPTLSNWTEAQSLIEQPETCSRSSFSSSALSCSACDLSKDNCFSSSSMQAVVSTPSTVCLSKLAICRNTFNFQRRNTSKYGHDLDFDSSLAYQVVTSLSDEHTCTLQKNVRLQLLVFGTALELMYIYLIQRIGFVSHNFSPTPDCT